MRSLIISKTISAGVILAMAMQANAEVPQSNQTTGNIENVTQYIEQAKSELNETDCANIRFSGNNYTATITDAQEAHRQCQLNTPGPVTKVSIAGVGLVDYQRLFTVESEPGESMDAFAVRIGPRIKAYSEQSGFEACGVIAQKDDKYSVVVGTNFGYVVCVNSGNLVVEGFKHAGATIHSHGKDGKFRPSKTDLAFMGQHFSGRNPNLTVVHGQKANEFSQEDHKSGAGYLAGSDGKLFHQANGRTRQVDIER